MGLRYRDAVNEGDLVDYSLRQAQTRFQEEGIRGANLSEEDRNTLIEQGLDPDEIDCEGTELERTLSNWETLRRQWEGIMEVCNKDEWGRYLTQRKIYFLSTQVAPLLRFVAGVDVVVATFTNKVEQLKLEILTDGAKPGTFESIIEDVSREPDFVKTQGQVYNR